MIETETEIATSEKRAATVALTVAVALTVVKFAAYFLTGSAAVFSDALENIVNVLASGLAMYSLAIAHAPADTKHPYGHGKVEFIAAGFEGGLVILAALVVAAESVRHMLSHSESGRLGTGVLLIAASMVVNAATGFYLMRSGRRHGSITLEADGKHVMSDAVTSAAVVVTLVVVHFTGLHLIDPVVAILVAVYLLYVGGSLLRRSYAGLMDEQDLADDSLIRTLLDAHMGVTGKEPKICSYHKLRHRHSGRYHWVDLHISIPASMTVAQGHDIASEIEYEIEQAVGVGNATAHMEPCTGEGCGVCGGKENAELRMQNAE